MHRRTLAPLLALAVAACGDAFTAGVSDGGSQIPPSDGSTLDVAVTDATTPSDGGGGDATQPGDGGVMHDAVAGDAITPPDEGGSPLDGPACLRTCPSGFQCIGGKCEDIAGLHFSVLRNPPVASNWIYGLASGPGGKPNLYTQEWKPMIVAATGSLDVWSKTVGDIELSVFHNPGLTAVDYAGMSVPPATTFTLGMYPSTSLSQVTAVRWIPPQFGVYDISVQFTGISTPPSKVAVGVSFDGTVGGNPADGGGPTSSFLNQFGAGNTFAVSVPGQSLSAQDTIDFYVSGPNNADDSPGGVSLAVLIVAE
jgi:hypothetical protein